MHEAARRISVPLDRKNETLSKYTMDIIGVANEKARIELRNATKKHCPKQPGIKSRCIYFPPTFPANENN